MRICKSRFVFLSVILVSSLCCSQSQKAPVSNQRTLQVEESVGGSVVTNLGYGIQVNKGSSLHRRWFVVNDPTCPIRLSGARIETVYQSGNVGGSYQYRSTGTATLSEPASALEIRFLLFDIWGDHMRTLSDTEVSDVTGQIALKGSAGWTAWENDVSELFTVVSFVARVRKADGTVWAYDPASLVREVEKIKVTLTEKELAPEKEKPKG